MFFGKPSCFQKAPIYVRTIYSYDEDIEKYHKWIEETKSKGCKSKAVKYLNELKRSLEKADKLEDVFSKYLTNPSGKYIVFCSNVRHMEEMITHVPEWFSGVNEDIDIYKVSFREPDSREQFVSYNNSRSSSLKLLFSVDMLNEGIHVVDVDGVILFRPTVSPIIYKQQIGRAISSSAVKRPLIIDVVNNFENLRSVASIQKEITEAAEKYNHEGRQSEIVVDHFEIIDATNDSIKLFEKLDNILSSNWDMYYEEAKAYYEENEDINKIPSWINSKRGVNLSAWIKTQRGQYKNGKLSADRITRLERIKISW